MNAPRLTSILTGVPIALALAIIACAQAAVVSRPAKELGEALFADPDLSTSGFNRFSCSTCHSATAAENGVLYAGFPLADSAHRDGWFDGFEAQYLDAVNFCLIFFMRGTALAPGDPYGDALYEYLISISPANPSPSIDYTLVNAIQVLPAGDAAAGELVYDAACRVCHGSKSGSGRISAETTKLDAALSAYYDQEFPGIDHDLIVIEKVRHGQFFGIGGNMPPFSQERLANDDLADLVAYLGL